MHNFTRIVGLLAFGLMLSPVVVTGEEAEEKKRFPQTGWSTAMRGGMVHQFDTDLDGGSSFDVNTYNIEIAQGYAWDARTSVSLGLSYTLDDYSFSRGGIGAGLVDFSPWDDIHTFSLGLPVRFGMGDNWTAFLIPGVRSSGESDASFSDTITGGGLVGAAYRFGDWLTIGPGIGVFSQLEDSAIVFPVLLIDWKITDRLSFSTGGGQAATVGPGLTLTYQVNTKWDVEVTGRYEKLRFRLGDKKYLENSIGEDSSIPIFLSTTYNFSPMAKLSLIGGVELDGELRVEDENGNTIVKESYDPAILLGFTFGVRF